jgi:DNA-binding protein YbaB
MNEETQQNQESVSVPPPLTDEQKLEMLKNMIKTAPSEEIRKQVEKALQEQQQNNT